MLGEGSGETRVLYAEGVWDRDAVSMVLASIVTDRRLSMDIFGQN